MFVCRCNDFYLPELDLWVDPQKPKDLAFVSHAHGDHVARHRKILATRATARLVRHRLGPIETQTLEFGEELQLRDGYTLCLHPAGHILGAAQLEVRHRGERLVYTGDFRLRAGATAAQCEVVPCDTLVMECTFGRPEFVFPPREEVIPRLVGAIHEILDRGDTPVVLAYAVGRSQELLKLLEPYDLPIALVPPIHAVTRVYEELGVRFGKYHHAADLNSGRRVLFVQPHASRSKWVRHAQRPVLLAATGWALNGTAGPPYPADRCFPFSDHADYSELCEYVREAGPKVVYTLHDQPAFLEHLRTLGISAYRVTDKVM